MAKKKPVISFFTVNTKIIETENAVPMHLVTEPYKGLHNEFNE